MSDGSQHIIKSICWSLGSKVAVGLTMCFPCCESMEKIVLSRRFMLCRSKFHVFMLHSSSRRFIRLLHLSHLPYIRSRIAFTISDSCIWWTGDLNDRFMGNQSAMTGPLPAEVGNMASLTQLYVSFVKVLISRSHNINLVFRVWSLISKQEPDSSRLVFWSLCTCRYWVLNTWFNKRRRTINIPGTLILSFSCVQVVVEYFIQLHHTCRAPKAFKVDLYVSSGTFRF